MKKYYTDEKNALITVALLKKHGIKRVIASPGTTNMALVASMQHDPFFEMYSSVDERSAAYIACGLAEETNEPVVISCTGATASRNYLPGMTEAFYRKLPILVITSSQAISKVGHLVAQVTDRSQLPKDAVRSSVTLPIIKDDDDVWDAEIKVNKAILELWRHGGGPSHINLPTQYSRNYTTSELPKCRKIDRITLDDEMPEIPEGLVAIFMGSHKRFSGRETKAIEQFCEKTGAVVFCDHTSGYYGRNRLLFSLVSGQRFIDIDSLRPKLLIHVGEVSGDYYNMKLKGDIVWRVSPDGEIRDTFRRLTTVFEMSEASFFESYAATVESREDNSYFNICKDTLQKVQAQIPELPFSNIWVASQLASRFPSNATVHLGILNSLRSWNFFEFPDGVKTASNVGGFGIDGGVSTLFGASLLEAAKPYFLVIGDLAFFYDLNSLGNRHIGKNIRILLINNGKGTEFRNYGHHAYDFGIEADEYISAGRHFGNKSPELVRGYVEALGFEYLTASSKESFDQAVARFLDVKNLQNSMVFEVFTDSDEESAALEIMLNLTRGLATESKEKLKGMAKQMLGTKGLSFAKKIIK